MSKSWSLLIAVAAVAVLSFVPVSAIADGVANDGPGAATTLLTGSPVPESGFGDEIHSCPSCPRLYDNTSICTVSVQAIALGGKTPNPMQPLDWFVTTGGNVTGFDLLVLNGASVEQSLTVQFYTGTNSQALGSPDSGAFFRTLGQPPISRIPNWEDPFTGRPGIIRVSVDYAALTYTLTGLSEDPSTGATVETPLNGGGEFLGEGPGRLPFSLPVGEAGVAVRLGNELSICNNGTPTGGPVLAAGGSGTQDGMHMLAGYTGSNSGDPAQCQLFELPLICDDPGWEPETNVGCDVDQDCIDIFGDGVTCGDGICSQAASVPCTGGDVCNLDRPFYGIALTLYAGTGEFGGGNNDISTADSIVAPAAGSGEIVSITGFIGDNGRPCDCSETDCACTDSPLYDHDDPPDGAIDLIDWGDFQRCFGNTSDPLCLVHDSDQDGDVDVDDFVSFPACADDPSLPECVFQVPPPANQLEDVDIFEIKGVSPGDVVALRLEGSKSATTGPLWDPFLRVFDGNGNQIPIADGVGGESDDFERFSFDAFTTVEVPAGSTSLYAGISTSGQIIRLSAPLCTEDADCVASGVGVCVGGDNDGSFCSSDAACPGCGDGTVDCPCSGTCGGVAEGKCDMPCTVDADCAFAAGFPPTATCGQLTPGFCDERVWYDPADASSISPLLQGSDAGGYTLSIARTDPNAVVDSGAGGQFDCVETRHEPDDSLADAAARGPTGQIFYGAIGDGAFAELGQDIDLWQIRLDGSDPLVQTENTRSITVAVRDIVGGGFPTAFDLVLALYNSEGELIATGDQAARGTSFDQTKPQFGVNVCGSNVSPPVCFNPSPDPGVYYIAVFGTDREQFNLDSVDCDDPNDTCPPFAVARPPSILNFPHGLDVAATAFADLRPVVGGRVNLPGARIVGRKPSAPPVPPNSAELQCYRINMSTSTALLAPTGSDVDEMASNGNDSIPDATSDLAVQDRLAGTAVTVRTLGNGRFGGHQGDADFYTVNGAGPGDLVSLNIADVLAPDAGDNRVRSYVALYDQEGFIIAEQDYSLEHYDPDIFVLDDISDEIAANVAAVIPETTGGGNPLSAVFALVGIDNGNLLVSENTPFDAAFSGTTLSRRFQTNVQTPRLYFINLTVLDLLPPSAGLSDRAFSVVRRGVDGAHTSTFRTSPQQSNKSSFPPIVELNPNTGEVVNLLDGTQGATTFFTFREPLDECQSDLGGCPAEVSSNPIIAYDGETLFVSTEVCNAGAQPCPNVGHPLFKVDPNLTPGDTGFVGTFGVISLDNPGFDAVLSGMVEMNGFLYALDTTSDRIRFWNKDFQPDGSNGGQTDVDELLNLSGTGGDGSDFDDLDGDLGTDGTSIYIPCFLQETSVGLCKFTPVLAPDGSDATFTLDGIVDDPITNDLLSPGPRIGGIDFLSGGLMMATDTNGPIVEYFDVSADAVTGVKLPREFLVERVTARNEAP